MLAKYKLLSLDILPRFYRKIPKIIWFSAAVFGIFIAGMLFDYLTTKPTDFEEYEDLSEKSQQYLDLITGYEELSNYYFYQGQNVSAITNWNLYETNPEEVAEAFESAKEYKDKILVQQGRIMELRKQAGLINE